MAFEQTFTGRPNTIRTKTSLFQHWVRPHVNPNNPNLSQVVTSWQQHLEPNTIKALLMISKDYVKYSNGTLLNIKPLIASVMRSKQEVNLAIPSQKDIVKFLQICKKQDPKLYLPVMLALHTGMRRGEIFGLLWTDVDLLKGRISVTKSYTGPTKNGKSRTIPISKELEEVLFAHVPVKSYNYIERVIPALFDPNPKLKNICNIACMNPITFHTLRHVFATLALEAKRSPKLVSKVLGHSKVSTTYDLYWSTINNEELDLNGFIPTERPL